jgi:hypothetical protein
MMAAICSLDAPSILTIALSLQISATTSPSPRISSAGAFGPSASDPLRHQVTRSTEGGAWLFPTKSLRLAPEDPPLRAAVALRGGEACGRRDETHPGLIRSVGLPTRDRDRAKAPCATYRPPSTRIEGVSRACGKNRQPATAGHGLSRWCSGWGFGFGSAGAPTTNHH